MIDLKKSFELFLAKNEKEKKLTFVVRLFSYLFLLSGIIIMYIHLKFFISFALFKIAIIIFRTGLFIEVSSIMSLYVINKFKEENKI